MTLPYGEALAILLNQKFGGDVEALRTEIVSVNSHRVVMNVDTIGKLQGTRVYGLRIAVDLAWASFTVYTDQFWTKYLVLPTEAKDDVIREARDIAAMLQLLDKVKKL